MKKFQDIKKEIDEIKEDIQLRANQKARDEVVLGIQEKLPKFEPNKVRDYLIELNKTNKELANSLNHPVGWEKVWLDVFEEKVA